MWLDMHTSRYIYVLCVCVCVYAHAHVWYSPFPTNFQLGLFEEMTNHTEKSCELSSLSWNCPIWISSSLFLKNWSSGIIVMAKCLIFSWKVKFWNYYDGYMLIFSWKNEVLKLLWWLYVNYFLMYKLSLTQRSNFPVVKDHFSHWILLWDWWNSSLLLLLDWYFFLMGLIS